MESGIVRRRTSVIAAHLASNEDIFATATHVLPMSCSNSLGSVIRRYDNRTNFARQGSVSQGGFMKQASYKQQGTHSQPGTLLDSTVKGNSNDTPYNSESPSYSRPAQAKPKEQPVVQGCRYTDPAPEAPTFARPNQKCGNPQLVAQTKSLGLKSNGYEWSPRMDVAESGLSYLVALEIPGVSADNIKVEVNNQSLIVTGNRTSWTCVTSTGCCTHKSASAYHKKEILQGPYRIVWPLPKNADKEHVSAEIQDGLLRISIPKLSGLRWLRKAHM